METGRSEPAAAFRRAAPAATGLATVVRGVELLPEHALVPSIPLAAVEKFPGRAGVAENQSVPQQTAALHPCCGL